MLAFAKFGSMSSVGTDNIILILILDIILKIGLIYKFQSAPFSSFMYKMKSWTFSVPKYQKSYFDIYFKK